MKHIHFDIKGDGFYGAYWVCKDGSDCAVIAMLGDDPEDYMARSAVKWLLRLGVNVLTMSPGKKDYGAITVSLQYYGAVRNAFLVPRQMFIPQPDVDSAVVDITPWAKKPLQADDEALFHHLVKAAFGQRRKTLNNALKTLKLDTPLLQSALTACNIDGTRRGETLSVSEFVALSNTISSLLAQNL